MEPPRTIHGTAEWKVPPRIGSRTASVARQIRNALTLNLLSVGTPNADDGRRSEADAARQ